MHSGRLFTVYDEIHCRPVRGSFPDEIMPLVKEALSKRVLASGIIRRNSAHQMVSIEVIELEVMPEDGDLPTVAEWHLWTQQRKRLPRNSSNDSSYHGWNSTSQGVGMLGS